MGVTRERDRVIQVKCPCCSRRLFDMAKDADCVISIKCAKCGAVVAVTMHHKNYRCKRQIVIQT